MSRITGPGIASATGATAEVNAQIKKAVCSVPNLFAALVRFVRTLRQSSGAIRVDEFAAIKAAGYTDRQPVEITLAIALTVFTNAFNRIYYTDLEFPPVKWGDGRAVRVGCMRPVT
ncbi:hypothetical protein GNZ12_43165 [Paraburkholderia sp. 1N]|uniref:Uncharacterized protein n=1 Tax=Paraburkholderia solitsugae TaxID=2675748 RepID=A0ABX2C4N3_9BURK|nr:hypothetical protein [Paraburkholderia solitsugae]NPT47979.1 hypothetical protein [Paraburkholderia solitsugae]